MEAGSYLNDTLYLKTFLDSSLELGSREHLLHHLRSLCVQLFLPLFASILLFSLGGQEIFAGSIEGSH